ncbi:MAG: ATP-dependent zinc metalloprotease FtsH [Planctomycetota bacterium]
MSTEYEPRPQSGGGPEGRGDDPKKRRVEPIIYLLVVGAAVLLVVTIFPQLNQSKIEYSEFLELLKNGEIEELKIGQTEITGKLRSEGGPESGSRPAKNWFVTAKDPTDKRLSEDLEQNWKKEYGLEKYEFEPQGDSTFSFFLMLVVPILLLILMWRFFFSRAAGGPGSALSFGKARARLYSEKDTKITFDDVAGVEEPKAELVEVIEYLRNPEKFRKLGAKIPKGILLVGSPGTGKTLLAKAVAGEAKVPFYSLSGSDFVEMFVGVGAARVRDLFQQAEKNAPCIIFIDELDALGKARSINPMGSHDEREQTLNQLLVQMDGFETNKGVLIMAATNRPEILDPALLRPGRFDRRVVIQNPDINEREAILTVHAKAIKLSKDVDLRIVASRTPGFVGADLANIVNEAALLAARRDKQQVEMPEFDEAIDRVIAGLEKRNGILNLKEKKVVAYHELGHALVAEYAPTADPVHKISIIPRSIGALGHTLQRPTEDRYLMTKTELLDKIAVLFGGRVAEELVFNEISTGAQNDIQHATNIARSMVVDFGMSDSIGLVSLGSGNRSAFLGDGGFSLSREISEQTASQVDSEVHTILEDQHERVREILRQQLELLHHLAGVLEEKETLGGDELRDLVSEFNGDGSKPANRNGVTGGEASDDGSESVTADASTRDANDPEGSSGEA